MFRMNSVSRILCWLGISLALAVVFAECGYGKDVRTRALTVHSGQSRMMRLGKAVDSVFVADPAIADVQVVSSQVLFVFGKAAGRTSVAALAGDGSLLGRWQVTVTLDLEPVRSALSGDPDLRDVKVRPWRQGIELIGVVRSTEVADRALQLARAALPEKTTVINRISVSNPQQVNLEVQIAEVQRSVSESLGINWEAFGRGGGGTFGFRVGRLFRTDDAAAPLGTATREGPAASLFGSWTSSGGSGSVHGLIDALATAGLATVLARPNITAVSGETASLFSGGEYPLPVGVEEGKITFEYKKYGVLLDFVPTVIDSQRIALTVRPEVSQRLATDSLKILNTEIPVIDVRRAETTIEVGNGESIVIAGLYRNQSDSTEAGVPVLKDVPMLGRLFGAQTTRSNSVELIVVVTARLIGPTPARTQEREKWTSGRVQGYHY